jgi:hypothetical protein
VRHEAHHYAKDDTWADRGDEENDEEDTAASLGTHPSPSTIAVATPVFAQADPNGMKDLAGEEGSGCAMIPPAVTTGVVGPVQPPHVAGGRQKDDSLNRDMTTALNELQYTQRVQHLQEPGPEYHDV